MKYFQYARNSYRTPKELIDIFTAVHNLEQYAKSIYKGRWEDILDRSFFHIVKNFDSSKGNLENYTIKVVRGIGLGDYKKECPTEFIEDLNGEEDIDGNLNTNLNKSKVESALFYTPEADIEADVGNCVRYLAPYYIKDFGFFNTLDGSKRKEDYNDLFKSFKHDVIREAIDYLNSVYEKDLTKFYEQKKKCTVRKASRDKVEKSLDTSIEYVKSLNDVIFFSRARDKAEVKKYFYKVDMSSLICQLLHDYYMFGDSSVKVCGVSAYLSLRGEILFSVEELVDLLEKDLYTFILSSSKLKVLVGDEIYLVGNKEVTTSVNIKIFGDNCSVNLINLASKEVKSSRAAKSGGSHA